VSLQEYVGTAPLEVKRFIDENIKAYCQSSDGISIWAKLAGLAAIVGGGLAYFMRHGSKSSPESQAENTRNQLLDIKQRIVIAQGRLKNLERANRAKQAKAQRKLIEQLNAQRRALERTQSNAEKKKQTEQHAEKHVLATIEYDDVARLRWKQRKGEVLYSDEEDILESVNAHSVP